MASYSPLCVNANHTTTPLVKPHSVSPSHNCSHQANHDSNTILKYLAGSYVGPWYFPTHSATSCLFTNTRHKKNSHIVCFCSNPSPEMLK